MRNPLSRYLAVGVVGLTLCLPVATMAKTTAAGTRHERPQVAVSRGQHRGWIKQAAQDTAPGLAKRDREPADPASRVSGTVAAISGTTITLTGADGKTYAVDASHAKLSEAMFSPSLSLANIVVGDRLTVKGAVSGTNISAAMIQDKSFAGRDVFAGTVTAVNGAIVSVNLNGNKSDNHPIDLSLASVTRGRGQTSTTIPVTDIKVGDKIFAVGSLSGSTITAKSAVVLGQFAKPGKGHGRKG